MRIFIYCISFCAISALLMNVYVIRLVHSKKTENQKESMAEMDYYYLQNSFNYQIESENAIINDCALCFSSDTNKINLSSLLNAPKLIFRISGNMCSPCVKFALREIEKIKNCGDNSTNIIIITSDMSLTEKKHLLGDNYYSLSGDSFLSNLQVEEYSIPFFFILDNTMKVRMLFVPEKASPRYTEKYLFEISRIIEQK